jgi:hypothetical protein
MLSRGRHSGRRVGRFRLPSATESESAYAALTNDDLATMTPAALRREHARVRVALALGTDHQLSAVRVDHPGTWTALGYFTAREAAILALLEAQGHSK